MAQSIWSKILEFLRDTDPATYTATEHCIWEFVPDHPKGADFRCFICGRPKEELPRVVACPLGHTWGYRPYDHYPHGPACVDCRVLKSEHTEGTVCMALVDKEVV